MLIFKHRALFDVVERVCRGLILVPASLLHPVPTDRLKHTGTPPKSQQAVRAGLKRTRDEVARALPPVAHHGKGSSSASSASRFSSVTAAGASGSTSRSGGGGGAGAGGGGSSGFHQRRQPQQQQQQQRRRSATNAQLPQLQRGGSGVGLGIEQEGPAVKRQRQRK